MAFPQHTVTGTAIISNSTSHVVNMPATVDAGDLLIMVGAVDGNPTFTFADSFVQRHLSANGTALTLVVATKTADGSEDGGTSTVTVSASERAAWQVFRVTAWHGTSLPEYGTAGTGTGTSADPPTCTPTWAQDDTLFITLLSTDATRTITTWPTNYGLDQTTQDSASGTGGGAAHTAGRELNATSDDPAAYTINTSAVWVVNTMAIRPVAAAAAALPPKSRRQKAMAIMPSRGQYG